MKQKLNVGVVVTLSGRWPRELPNRRFEEYGGWLERSLPESRVFRFEKLIGSREDMAEIRYKYVQYYEEGLKKLDHQGHSWKLSMYASDILVEDVKNIIRLSGSAGTV